MTTRLRSVLSACAGSAARTRYPTVCQLGRRKALSTLSRLLRGRNLLAKYAPNSTTQRQAGVLTGSQSLHDAFTTISTHPVGSSLQAVPPPTSEAAETGRMVEDPIPAMVSPQPISQETATGAMSVKLDASQTRKPLRIQGVTIPSKPRPPGEEECCMSGCVHCVYTIYADDLEEYTSALKSAKDALLAAHVPQSDWPEEVVGVDEHTVQEEKAEVVQHLDPSMAAFLALEGKLKNKSSP